VARSISERERMRLVQAVLVTGLVVGLAVHAWDGRTPRAANPAGPPPVAVRFSLAPQSGSLDRPIDGNPVVALTVIVSNDGTSPVTVLGVDVSGPGAALVDDPPGGPSLDLPQPVDPGHETTIRFGIVSRCAVAVRPPPTVTVSLRRGGSTSDVAADIPGFDSVWGLTLQPGACPSG